MAVRISVLFFILIMTAGTLPSVASPYERTENPMNKEDKIKSATFAGGCFWCLEADFEKVDGVAKVISGYTGGKAENPSYREVCSGKTGHLEAVQIYYDSTITDYRKLLEVFWRHIDPSDGGGQFIDRGAQYTSAIFYHNERQRKLAEYSRDRLRESGIFSRPIATRIDKLDRFWQAE
ncbi:MAG TPA: peptide-methionine (S)-S-oxide reductase MsrA, partial [Candidatus Krumholzibacteriaceae bacterium]|nr:peptide-methionine (S)-S-oxide reductase MsrA [Candidatus Krumholzibacteriaceae bacterium]